MQRVSKAYKKSMKSSLRERAYIMISFGLMNQEAQANARILDGDYAVFSNNGTVFRERKGALAYATLEENFRWEGGVRCCPPPPPGGGGGQDFMIRGLCRTSWYRNSLSK